MIKRNLSVRVERLALTVVSLSLVLAGCSARPEMVAVMPPPPAPEEFMELPAVDALTYIAERKQDALTIVDTAAVERLRRGTSEEQQQKKKQALFWTVATTVLAAIPVNFGDDLNSEWRAGFAVTGAAVGVIASVITQDAADERRGETISNCYRLRADIAQRIGAYDALWRGRVLVEQDAKGVLPDSTGNALVQASAELMRNVRLDAATSPCPVGK